MFGISAAQTMFGISAAQTIKQSGTRSGTKPVREVLRFPAPGPGEVLVGVNW
jgi:hypothetical protein